MERVEAVRQAQEVVNSVSPEVSVGVLHSLIDKGMAVLPFVGPIVGLMVIAALSLARVIIILRTDNVEELRVIHEADVSSYDPDSKAGRRQYRDDLYNHLTEVDQKLRQSGLDWVVDNNHVPTANEAVDILADFMANYASNLMV